MMCKLHLSKKETYQGQHNHFHNPVHIVPNLFEDCLDVFPLVFIQPLLDPSLIQEHGPILPGLEDPS